MIYILYFFVEILFLCIYYNILINKEFNKNIYINVIVSAVISILYKNYSTINGNVATITFIFILIFIISTMERKSKMLVMIELCIAVIYLCTVQLFTQIIFLSIPKNFRNDVVQLILLLIIFILVGAITQYFFKNLEFDIEVFLNKSRLAWIMIINVILVCLIMRLVLNNSLIKIDVTIEFAILLVSFIIVNINGYRAIFKQIEEKRKLEADRQYKVILDELIDKFRIDEHEYKNHLNTLNSIIELEGSDELKLKIGNYISNAIKKDKYSNLKYIDNTIIKAVIYNKLQQCDNNCIDFKYDIKSNLTKCNLQDIDLSIVLNNLLNNAIEAVINLDERKVEINIVENDKYEIEVKNTISSKVKINFEDIFKKGKSSKGKNRGYGLYTIKKIVEKNKGIIQLSNKENYLIIKIII